MPQILRFKNRQKGDQFLYQMSDFCENCNPHSSYHTTAVGNVWLIFDLQKYVNWLHVFLEVKPCFQKAHVFLYGSTASCRSIQCCMYFLVCSKCILPQAQLLPKMQLYPSAQREGFFPLQNAKSPQILPYRLFFVSLHFSLFFLFFVFCFCFLFCFVLLSFQFWVFFSFIPKLGILPQSEKVIPQRLGRIIEE